MKAKKIPLEDRFEDILGKALRGRGMDVAAVANAAGVSPSLANGMLSGSFDEQGARLMATALGLDPDRLTTLARGEYEPEEIEPMEGLLMFNTPFDDMTVNSYLVWDPATKKAAAFDTGSDCGAMLESLEHHGLTLENIFLTHSHGDHIYDLDRLKEKTGATAWTPEAEPVEGAQPFSPGRKFQIGSLNVETRLTWGHSKGGVTYVIEGLSRRLAMVGDAIFAGSMGGGGVSYEAALNTNKEQIFTLPDSTVICPGHGPLTTVGEQKRVNPFFPDVQ